MPECEFKKECTMAAQGRPCPFSDSEAKNRRCDDRKFAILVVNRTVDNVEHILVDAGLPTINKRCQALKMEEE